MPSTSPRWWRTCRLSLCPAAPLRGRIQARPSPAAQAPSAPCCPSPLTPHLAPAAPLSSPALPVNPPLPAPLSPPSPTAAPDPQAPAAAPALLPEAENGSPGSSAVAAWQARTALLLGSEGLERLRGARVLVLGCGGVGSYACEALARAGVGALALVDADTVDVSNTNRQLHALHSTVGQVKVQLMAQRLRDINPHLALTVQQEFLTPEGAEALLLQGCRGAGGEGSGSFDWVVDAIDSVRPKQLLIASAFKLGIPLVTAMGAGGRLDPGRVRVVPLSTTFNDSFAALLRKGLRRLGVDLDQVPCVWSDEPALQHSLAMAERGQSFKRSYFGTISYLPAVFGLHAAAFVINQLLEGPMAGAYAELPRTPWASATSQANVGGARKKNSHDRRKQKDATKADQRNSPKSQTSMPDPGSAKLTHLAGRLSVAGNAACDAPKSELDSFGTSLALYADAGDGI